VPDIGQNAMANLKWNEVRPPHPVFVGDTIYADSEMLSKRESKSRPLAGIVHVQTRGLNQNGAVVIILKRATMVYKGDFAPQRKLLPTPKNENDESV